MLNLLKRMKIIDKSGELSPKELEAYKDYVCDKYKGHGKTIDTIEVIVDGDYVDLKITFAPTKFERIRRITGYLVGTTDRWNNAKRAELSDREKHGI